MQLLNVTKSVFAAVIIILVALAPPAVAQNDCGFDNWDRDTSDYLDANEFGSALTDVDYFGIWDEDGDGYLTEEEWDAGVDGYFGVYGHGAYGDYTDWDVDDDEQLSEDEFDEGIFDTVDDDDNDYIEEDEWDVFDEEEDGLFC